MLLALFTTIWKIIRSGVGFAVRLFVKDEERIKERTDQASLFVGTLLVALVLVFFGWLMEQACGRSDSELQREADAKGDIAIGLQNEANVQQKQVEKDQANVEAAEKGTRRAEKELEKSNKTDSSKFEASQAEDKFCSRWPQDSSCAAWRKRHLIE